MNAFAFLFLTVLFWSGNFVVARAFGSELGAIHLSFYRWLVVCILLAPFLPKAINKILQSKNHSIFVWLKIGLMSLLSVTIFNTFIYIGLTSTLTTNALLINSMIPFFIIALNFIIFHQRISPKETLGVIISLFGVSYLALSGDFSNLATLNLNVGDIWILLAAFCWGLYSALVAKWKPWELSALEFLTVSSFIGLICLLPLYIMNPFNEVATYNTSTLLSVLYVAIFSSLLANIFYIKGIELIGSDKSGQFIHLMPFLGTVLAYVFLDESVVSYQFIGGALIFSGLIISNKITLTKSN